jgi:hypothetical protein
MVDERASERTGRLTRRPAADAAGSPGRRRGVAGQVSIDGIRPRFSGRKGRWLLVVLLLIGVVGCGGRRLHPVRGKVVYKEDETPLRGGLVVFEPVDPAAKVSASGPIQADGTFRLGTEKEGDGAPEGKYRVLVEPPRQPNRDERKPPTPLIHPRFRKLDTSGLEYTVVPGPNEFNIKVERP